MVGEINNSPKSSQDLLGKILSVWRNNRVYKEIIPPFLDLGCGDNRLKSKLYGGVGIDIINYGTADVIVKNFDSLPFKPSSFKTIAIVGSLNYFEDPLTVLAEGKRVLDEKGIIVLTMIDQKIGRIWHSFREPWAKYPGFTSEQLIGFCKKLELKILKKRRFMLGLNNLYVFGRS